MRAKGPLTSWETLDSQLTGNAVYLRGFLYQAPDASWILSREPNLKSCCVGASHNTLNQVTLLGDWSHLSSHQAITLKGTLQAVQEHNRWVLDQIEIEPSHPSYNLYLGLVSVFLAVSLAFIKRKRRKRKSY